ncbi:MAG: antibiotic biosynthesis monooxygenase [Gammaproteobacteria bacterium]|nr:antibiotic biosynthesis monooxygenase [Gammaproteobacteria bacterium]
MSTVTVRMRVKPEMEAEFLRIFRDVAAIVESDESDCTIYAVWETGLPHEYFLVESYRSEAGRALHNARHAAVFEAFMACLAAPPATETLGAQALGIPR